MNAETKACCKARCAYAVAILGAFLIVAALVAITRRYTQPEPLNANRAAERAKALGEIRADEADKLNSVGWVDPTKGLVRLPITNAMAMVVQQWGRNPAAARSNLIARVDKANPPPPPPKPAAPSPFE